MKRFITLISLLSLVTLLSAQEKQVIRKERKDLPAKLYKEGTSFYRSGSYSKAIQSYNKAFKLLENYNENKEKIHSRYEDESQRKKIMIYASLGSARSAGKTNKIRNATNYFQQAISIDKEDEKSWLEFGKFLASRPNKTEAKNALLNAIKYAESNFSNPNSKLANRAKSIASDSYYQLGKIEKSRNKEKAISYFVKAIDLDSDDYQPYLYLGNLYQSVKKYSKMTSTFEKLENLLNSKRKSSRYKRVIRKQMPTVKYKLGVAFYESKRYNESIKKLNEAIKIANSAKKNASYYYLGLNYKKLQQESQAINQFKKVKKGPFRDSANYEIDLLTKYKQ